MKIVIIGPGALGSLFAALLAAGPGNDVWLLDHDAERAAQIDGKLLLTHGQQEFCRLVSATADAAGIGPADLILHCVKSRDVAAGIEAASPLFSPRSIFISFQNGISHLDILAGMKLPMEPALGVTALGATLFAPGRVCHGGEGMTRIGFVGPVGRENQQRLEEVAALFRRAGMATERVENIVDVIWAKLLVNLGINALTVLYDCPNGALLAIGEARKTLIAAVREGEEVARALGIRVGDDPVNRTLAVCRATADNISSMLQDVRKGKPTEIDAINGALLAKAEALGIDVPVNRELVGKVRELEAGYLRKAPHGQRPDRL
ncbi:MAG: 2-dehydropantoate 2-reductase [Pseudomonadota bacterium]